MARKTIASLQIELDVVKEMNEELEKRLTAAEDKAAVYEQDLDRSEERVKQLEAQLADANERLEKARTLFVEQRNSLRQLRTKAPKAKAPRHQPGDVLREWVDAQGRKAATVYVAFGRTKTVYAS